MTPSQQAAGACKKLDPLLEPHLATDNVIDGNQVFEQRMYFFVWVTISITNVAAGDEAPARQAAGANHQCGQ